MKTAIVFAALTTLLLVGCAGASPYLQVTGPVTGTLYQQGSLYLGKVGPGQSFYILASASTANASGVPINIGWDTINATQLPSGWSAQSSPLYENPMKLKVTVPSDAANGTYRLVVKAVNIQNYSRLGNLTFTAFINVTPNVFNLNVAPTSISVGVGQPYSLKVTINNTGASDDPFVINAQGLPAWNVSDDVIAQHSTVSTFTYPVYVNEPGIYSFNITVASASSSLISKSYKINMVAKASLLNDFAAVGQGVPLSPIIYEPTYAVMLLVKYVIGAI
ncbi:MAG: hypothetical protein KGH61_02405 [Candidatus Micrarchaeota archaeon]|nr:hypothetical protein [Candidatus Micrarchaeota archaeon]MDE1847779.1 hypothetical protein [Candidatus Micrarchaeota archaeon]MDE1864217.1 hypothetical protein [Candidatus Micrarchaeota archaeon]